LITVAAGGSCSTAQYRSPSMTHALWRCALEIHSEIDNGKKMRDKKKRDKIAEKKHMTQRLCSRCRRYTPWSPSSKRMRTTLPHALAGQKKQHKMTSSLECANTQQRYHACGLERMEKRFKKKRQAPLSFFTTEMEPRGFQSWARACTVGGFVATSMARMSSNDTREKKKNKRNLTGKACVRYTGLSTKMCHVSHRQARKEIKRG
jgi:hypothetical protein